MADYTKTFLIPIPDVGLSDEAILDHSPVQITIPDVELADEAILDHSPVQIAIPDVGIAISSALSLENAIALAVMRDTGDADYDYTEEANEDTANDVPLLPPVVGANDGFIFLAEYKFQWILFNVGTAGAGTYTLSWLYWNGAWTALTVVYDSTNNFKSTGYSRCHIVVPDDWIETSVMGTSGYAIFVRYSDGTMTARPLANRLWLPVPPTLPKYSGRHGRGFMRGVMK